MITGGIKFLEPNKNLLKDGASATASSGASSKDSILDKNEFTFWTSVGSDDTTTETLVVTFPASLIIDRILLLDHNFKEFTIKYDLASVFTDFANVVGLDGALGGGISETVFADDTAYYEFDPVTTTRIEITCTKAQIVDAQKFLAQVISTEEIETLVGFPQIRRLSHSRNARAVKVLSGKSIIQKSLDSLSFELQFKDYPPTLETDLALPSTLFERSNSFLVWLCGGRRGTTFFRFTNRGFRLKDIPEMQMERDMRTTYRKNVYTLPPTITFRLRQVP